MEKWQFFYRNHRFWWNIRILNVRFDNFGYFVEFPEKNQFPNKPWFPLPALIILVWYSYVSPFPSSLCSNGLSVSGFRKIRFNAYTLRRISTKKSIPKQTRIPIVHVDNFSMVSLRFTVPWFIVLSVWVSAVYPKYVSTPIQSFEFSEKNHSPNKPGFSLSALIISDLSYVDRLFFKKESRKNRIMINRVCLAIPKGATITWKKLRK